MTKCPHPGLRDGRERSVSKVARSKRKPRRQRAARSRIPATASDAATGAETFPADDIERESEPQALTGRDIERE
jgi:hypothetical protein